MSVHRVVVDVSGVSAYPGSANVTCPFVPKTCAIINESPAVSVLVSFDGVTDHAKLTPGLPSQGLVLRQGAQSLWVKRDAAGATTVQFIFES